MKGTDVKLWKRENVIKNKERRTLKVKFLNIRPCFMPQMGDAAKKTLQK